jgi:hypothetical protein
MSSRLVISAALVLFSFALACGGSGEPITDPPMNPSVPTPAGWPEPPKPFEGPDGCCCTFADELDASVRWVARADCDARRSGYQRASCDATPKDRCGVY